jgi:hypothetical protein
VAEIGKPEKEIYVEPVRLPERHPVPEPAPPAEPAKAPERPEKVPA